MNSRFWSKVDKAGPIPEHRPELGQCWPWTGYIHPSGYGRFWVGGEHPVRQAHAVAWEESNGPVPNGLDVLHRCDNRPCCRASHLFTGTQGENNADRDTKGRAATGSDTAGNRKLADGQVREVRQALGRGEVQRSIARRFGVSQFAIYCIAAGRSYRWVT